MESGHYASQQIQQISGQLEQEWKAFAAALDERSTLLEMSASFHQKADQVQKHRKNPALTITKDILHALNAPFVRNSVYSLITMYKNTSTYPHTV